MVKNLPFNAGRMEDVGSVPGLGKFPGGERINPLHYSCLEKPMDREGWQPTIHRVAKSQTRLKQLNIYIDIHMYVCVSIYLSIYI